MFHNKRYINFQDQKAPVTGQGTIFCKQSGWEARSCDDMFCHHNFSDDKTTHWRDFSASFSPYHYLSSLSLSNRQKCQHTYSGNIIIINIMDCSRSWMAFYVSMALLCSAMLSGTIQWHTQDDWKKKNQNWKGPVKIQKMTWN